MKILSVVTSSTLLVLLQFTTPDVNAQTKSATKDAKGKQFIIDSAIPWEDLGGGLKRKIMSYDDNMMMVKIVFEKGGIGKPHQHIHTQMSYVESGTFEVTIGNEVKILQKGDGYYIPPNVMHGAICKEAGVLIDMFTPMREDFVKK